MTIRIGIPRTLYYYRYFPLWKILFEELGFEVIISRPSHRSLVEEGFKFADDDTCLPIKMAYSHTLNIKDQVDFLFIPRLVSVEPKTCCCPRMAGLPEMLKYSIPKMPALLAPYVDERYRDSRLYQSLFRMAAELGKRSEEIKEAYRKGKMNYQAFQVRMQRGEKVPELFAKLERETLSPRKKIALVGHPYCLYDPYFNFNLLNVLEEARVAIHTQERVTPKDIDSEIQQMRKDIYWSSGREILGASLHYLRTKEVDGLIYLTCFSCGVDSMIEPLVRHKANEEGEVLYLCLMFDEHTGPAGILTRVEAFLETVERRKANRRTE
ncbi:MAG: acyl-CoA dehydratase activase-related protein [Thermodesulfobacteriota bacterium]|nr:acyl-CoA dehydratase activase-related protein [Thermodesulfobacteriota bacterium]